MQKFLLVIGAIAAAIGAITLGFGIEVYDFSFGNTLIVAGTTSLMGGIIVVGLAAAVRELGRIADTISARSPSRVATRAEPSEPQMIAGYRQSQSARPTFSAKDHPDVAVPNGRSIEGRPSPTRSGGGFDEPPAARQRQNVYPLVRPTAESILPEDLDSVALSPRTSARANPARVDTMDLAHADIAALTVGDVGIGDIRANDARADLRASGPRVGDIAGQSQLASKASVAQSASAEGAVLETQGPRGVPSTEDPQTDLLKRINLFDAVWPAAAKQRAPFSKESAARDLNSESAALAHARVEPVLAASPREDAARTVVEPRPVSVLKSGVVDGMAYTLYTDGSIEAQLSQNTVRFNSIDELRAHLESIS